MLAAKDAVKHILGKMDTNADGKITANEFDKGEMADALEQALPRVAMQKLFDFGLGKDQRTLELAFDSLDKDGGGNISEDEFNEQRKKGTGVKADDVFDVVDLNKDNVIQRFEFESAMVDPAGAMFAKADADHNGFVSKEEFFADAQTYFPPAFATKDMLDPYFAHLDHNKDGKLSSVEFQAHTRSRPKASKPKPEAATTGLLSDLSLSLGLGESGSSNFLDFAW